MRLVLAIVASLSLAACTHHIGRDRLELEEGAVVSTDFAVQIDEVHHGAEDSPKYHSTVKACDVVSGSPDIVRVAPTTQGWLVWGTGPGIGWLELTPCGETQRLYVDVIVTPPK